MRSADEEVKEEERDQEWDLFVFVLKIKSHLSCTRYMTSGISSKHMAATCVWYLEIGGDAWCMRALGFVRPS